MKLAPVFVLEMLYVYDYMHETLGTWTSKIQMTPNTSPTDTWQFLEKKWY